MSSNRRERTPRPAPILGLVLLAGALLLSVATPAPGRALDLGADPAAWPAEPAGTERDAPVAVSPGNATELAGSPSPCPPFSWILLPEAREYDLVVVEIPEELQESRLQRRFEVPDDREAVVLRQRIPGGASHWQPSTSRCFSPARRYAWSVRARHDTGWGPWSEPLLFSTPGVRTVPPEAFPQRLQPGPELVEG